MSMYEHFRFKIFNQGQHPYKHELGDFTYTNPRLPTALTLGDAMDYLVAVSYPNFVAEVANQAALPAAGNTVGDYYLVVDDGDGKRAGYVWQMVDGTEQWFKRFDVDWSTESLIASAYDSVNFRYVHKYGTADRDGTDAFFAGDLAGQRIYGGDSANEHLILYANSGDIVGNTGFIQAGDDFRPLTDSSFTLGTDTYRWSNFFTDLASVGTLVLASGSITDTSGAISFGDENLTTTGTFGCGVLTAASGSSIGTLTLSDGSIVDSTGAISFGDENLSTTGTLTSLSLTTGTMTVSGGSIVDSTGAISFGNENLTTTGTLSSGNFYATQALIDDVLINGSTISINTLNTNLNLAANGTGFISLSSALATLGVTVTGTLGVTGQANVDNLRLDGNTLSTTDVNGDLILSPNGSGQIQATSIFYPGTNSAFDLGKTGSVWNDIWFDGSIQNDTDVFLNADLFSLKNTVFRDAARTQAVQAGDTLFWDVASSSWLANHPDTEITHSELTGLTTTDAGHTQFVMLAGRAGGQTIQGGTAASENLVLESTSDATKGSILSKDNISPFTNASYVASWAGTDLGDATHYYRDIYTKGQAKGLRVENFLFAGLPVTSASSPGRLLFTTDTKHLYLDTGLAVKRVGNVEKHIEDLAFNGTDTVKNVDVSANISDARNAVKQLLDNSNDFENMQVSIKATTATNVRITTNIALPAGAYRLIVME